MQLPWLQLLVVPTVLALAIQKRDADFYQVRTKMGKDMSGRKGDPSGKYFHESVFHPHYDGRFADRQLSYQQRRQALSNLMQTYLSTMADLGVETWLMHGTLLGWWWNRKIMPWDSDSDVQVSESSMHYLAAYYNMSVFHYKTPRIPDGRDYLMEINPHYINREQSDKMNVIDARWIDTTSGLFIDITTARYNLTHPAGKGMISCKDGHEYRDTYIFPLRETYFEGVPAKIPYAYKELLEAEYRPKALTNTEFEGHKFDEDKLEWIPIKRQVDPPKPEEKKPEEKKPEEKKPEEKKPEEKKPEEKKPDPPKQESPAQQAQPQNQQPIKQEEKKPDTATQVPAQAQNQGQSQSQPVVQSPTQEQPKPAEPVIVSVQPVADAAAQAQASTESLKPVPVPPAIPAEQLKFEAKIQKQEEKQDAILQKAEDRRKAAEEKFIEKEKKRIQKEQILAANKAAKEQKEKEKLEAAEKQRTVTQAAVAASQPTQPVAVGQTEVKI